MTRIDLALIEAFAVVVRSGGLTQAEGVSGISKATLSRQITRLEELLGAQLLMRSPRKVAPTEAGRAFFARCEGLLDEVTGRIEAACTEVQEITAGGAGSLSVLSDTQFGTSFVCHVVRLFLEAHPGVACRLDVADRPHAPAIADVDCYVCAEPPDAPNLVAKLLGRLGQGLYASAAYLEKHGMPAGPAELARHRAIVLKESAAPVQLVSAEGRHAYRPVPAFETNDHWVTKTFCIDGAGIALLPVFFARPEVEQGVLVPVLPQWQPEPRRIYCAYQRQRYMGRKLRAFVDLMARCVVDIDSTNVYVGSAGPGRARARP